MINQEDIKIEGRSKCKIEIIDAKPAIFRKYSKSINYNQRLFLQQEKQKNFDINFMKSGYYKFMTPKIYNFENGEDKKLTFVDMEYINGLKFSDYFLYITIPQLYLFAESLIKYINYIKSKSDINFINFEVFEKKL